MTEKYVPQEIEPKWQQRWEADGLYRAVRDPKREKWYYLTMYPYPSGDLHMGHWYAMAPSDAHARFYRMRGYNVLFPMGFDAFGLPAENAAIKRGIHPKTWTYNNIERMRRQLRSMGAMFDWDREVVTCDPEYYKWNQWFFLKFYERGLAYRKKAPVDWCPTCKTTLAREQVHGEERVCERCGTPVIKRDLEQWFFKITAYAEELLDFSQLDWPERVITLQRNWIGRSEGAEVVFKTEQGDEIVVFTTRPDTLWGATFMVLAPEHPLVEKVTTPERRAEVEAYVAAARRMTDVERESVEREKTGVFTGGYAVNPVNGEQVPIWVADYVLMTYGTGAIMAVPAHDMRDFEFALKFGIPVIPVIAPPQRVARSCVMKGTYRDGLTAALEAAGFRLEEHHGSLHVTVREVDRERYIALVQKYIRPGAWTEVIGAGWHFVFADTVMNVGSVEEERRVLARCRKLAPAAREWRTVAEMLWAEDFYRDVLFHAEYGTMINSGPLTGTPGDVAVKKTTEWLEGRGMGRFAVNYRLRDWLISRQRYWGTPIPIIYCDRCGIVPVPEEDLPVLLPEDVEFQPTGVSPLTYHEGFLNTTCPRCNGPARRETDTMDTFVDSSWYQYRYLGPFYEEGPWDPEEGAYWLPVDQYTGGVEHATMHLLYTRFFTKVLRDLGLVDFDEPMVRLYNQGTILGEPREGDFVVVEGQWESAEGTAFRAARVRAVRGGRKLEPGAGADYIQGEVYGRDEAGIRVNVGGNRIVVVHVDKGTEIEVPGVAQPELRDLTFHLDAEKMSKSKGNVVAPDELVARYGADTVRAYLMFAFRWDQGGPWNSQGIEGVHRWLHRVWHLLLGDSRPAAGDVAEADVRALRRKTHQTIKRVTTDLEEFAFNTAIAALMELTNTMQKAKETPLVHTDAWREARDTLLVLMAPFTPHIAEEIWVRTGHAYSVHQQPWPAWNEELTREETITLVVQVNGKVRDKIPAPAGLSEEEARKLALASPKVQRHLDGKQVRKVIFAQGKIINIVAS